MNTIYAHISPKSSPNDGSKGVGVGGRDYCKVDLKLQETLLTMVKW